MTTLASASAAPATDSRDLGVNFPVLGPGRSSTLAAKLVLNEALRGVDDEAAGRIARLEDRRTFYPSAYVDLTREARRPLRRRARRRTGERAGLGAPRRGHIQE